MQHNEVGGLQSGCPVLGWLWRQPGQHICAVCLELAKPPGNLWVQDMQRAQVHALTLWCSMCWIHLADNCVSIGTFL